MKHSFLCSLTFNIAKYITYTIGFLKLELFQHRHKSTRRFTKITSNTCRKSETSKKCLSQSSRKQVLLLSPFGLSVHLVPPIQTCPTIQVEQRAITRARSYILAGAREQPIPIDARLPCRLSVPI